MTDKTAGANIIGGADSIKGLGFILRFKMINQVSSSKEFSDFYKSWRTTQRQNAQF
jgi:hypothetical protein